MTTFRTDRGPTSVRRIVVTGGLPSSLLNFRGELIRAMVARGHSVLAVAGGESAEVRSGLSEIGARYEPIPLRRASLDPLNDLRTLAAFRRLLARERPDVLLAYTIKPVVYGHLAGRMVGVPDRFALITGAGYAFGSGSVRQRMAGRVATRLYRTALRGAAGVIFQNEDDRRLFRDRRIVREDAPTFRVEGSGVELEHFARRPIPEGDPEVLMIARLLREKGVYEFCQAAREVRRTHPRARFRLVGPPVAGPSGIDEEDLGPWISDGSIEYRGRTDDVRPALAASSIFVLPSGYGEGLPRTILEAMATGRPIVTTDSPGCRDTVRPGDNGALVPVGDAGALAARIRQILEAGRPEIERMGAASRRMAEERFDVHRVNRNLLDIMGL